MRYDIRCGEGRPDGSTCGAVPTKLYPRGNRCPNCAPQWMTPAETVRARQQLAAMTR